MLVIRTMANYATVPIVLLTAYDNSELRGRAAGAGATAVLAKPFTTAQLREAVLPLIALGRRRGRPAHAIWHAGRPDRAQRRGF